MEYTDDMSEQLNDENTDMQTVDTNECQLPPALLQQTLSNAAVPAHQQAAGTQSKDSYKFAVMDMLYEGAWKFAYPFTETFMLIAAFLKHLILSEHQKRNWDKAGWKVKVWIEFVLALLCRMRNEQHLVPLLIALSMYAYIHQVSGSWWTVLCFMRVLYSKQWTKKWSCDMANRMPPPPFPVCKRLWVETGDNHFILFRRHAQRVGKTHYNCDMINRIRMFANEANLPERINYMDLTHGPRTRPVGLFDELVQRLNPQHAFFDSQLISKNFRRIQDGHVHRFADRPHGLATRTPKQYLRPMVNCNANSDEGVDT